MLQSFHRDFIPFLKHTSPFFKIRLCQKISVIGQLSRAQMGYDISREARPHRLIRHTLRA